jgi:hypothetical protein
VVPVADLDGVVNAIAGQLVKQPAGSLKQTKLLLRQARAIAAQMALESSQFAERLRAVGPTVQRPPCDSSSGLSAPAAKCINSPTCAPACAP